LCLGTIADVCPYFLDGLVFWLRFDILAERILWFSQYGSVELTFSCRVSRFQGTSQGIFRGVRSGDEVEEVHLGTRTLFHIESLFDHAIAEKFRY
jgi:hypothetical protein